MSNFNNLYFISWDDNNTDFRLWSVDFNSPSLLKSMPVKKGSSIPKDSQLIQVGSYLLQWSKINKDNKYNYRLLEFNPSAPNPIGSSDSTGKWTDKALQAGVWDKSKFFGSRVDFANPDGAEKGFESGTELVLVSTHNFVLNWIPTDGRGTYQLFNFDHASGDPLPGAVTPQGAWLTIQKGHQLLYTSGYVIDWEPKTGNFSIWQFDAQNENPLSFPSALSGNWLKQGITQHHELIVLGQFILDREPDGKFRLWQFDMTSETGLSGPLAHGTLPKVITSKTKLTGVETLTTVDAKVKSQPGTMDFMRDKIKHVVYYMIENRSFDHVCGWLYSKNAPIHVIGPDGPYKGVDPNFKNKLGNKEYAITKYNNGKLSKDKDFKLDLDKQDPYHDYSDVIRQMYSADVNDYYRRKTPDMGGFALNNGTPEVMLGYSPEQLPVLNGLAKHFAISDEWFCSMPGGTDVNRAFSLTGSSLGMLNNFQNGNLYTEWADQARRPSIWKILWSNGISDFKIYNSVEWMNCRFTYNLFLKGQIPYIDNIMHVGNYCPQMNQFYDDAKYGTLAKFSFLEPIWVANAGSTSYHPGNDLIPGERSLNEIFNALQNSPQWEDTLFVITFDEHGGLPDHVPPPYTVNPFMNDQIQNFNFDVMGVRVPTILVSPWIKENTVFRSETGMAYDSTSILATLLDWVGVPRSRWGMGERVYQAPTFESVLSQKKVRKDKIKLTPPYDSLFPKDTKATARLPIHGLHELIVPRMVAEMAPHLSRAERVKLAEEVLGAGSLAEMHSMLNNIHNTYKK